MTQVYFTFPGAEHHTALPGVTSASTVTEALRQCCEHLGDGTHSRCIVLKYTSRGTPEILRGDSDEHLPKIIDVVLDPQEVNYEPDDDAARADGLAIHTDIPILEFYTLHHYRLKGWDTSMTSRANRAEDLPAVRITHPSHSETDPYFLDISLHLTESANRQHREGEFSMPSVEPLEIVPVENLLNRRLIPREWEPENAFVVPVAEEGSPFFFQFDGEGDHAIQVWIGGKNVISKNAKLRNTMRLGNQRQNHLMFPAQRRLDGMVMDRGLRARGRKKPLPDSELLDSQQFVLEAGAAFPSAHETSSSTLSSNPDFVSTKVVLKVCPKMVSKSSILQVMSVAEDGSSYHALDKLATPAEENVRPPMRLMLQSEHFPRVPKTLQRAGYSFHHNGSISVERIMVQVIFARRPGPRSRRQQRRDDDAGADDFQQGSVFLPLHKTTRQLYAWVTKDIERKLQAEDEDNDRIPSRIVVSGLYLNGSIIPNNDRTIAQLNIPPQSTIYYEYRARTQSDVNRSSSPNRVIRRDPAASTTFDDLGLDFESLGLGGIRTSDLLELRTTDGSGFDPSSFGFSFDDVDDPLPTMSNELDQMMSPLDAITLDDGVFSIGPDPTSTGLLPKNSGEGMSTRHREPRELPTMLEVRPGGTIRQVIWRDKDTREWFTHHCTEITLYFVNKPLFLHLHSRIRANQTPSKSQAKSLAMRPAVPISSTRHPPTMPTVPTTSVFPTKNPIDPTDRSYPPSDPQPAPSRPTRIVSTPTLDDAYTVEQSIDIIDQCESIHRGIAIPKKQPPARMKNPLPQVDVHPPTPSSPPTTHTNVDSTVSTMPPRQLAKRREESRRRTVEGEFVLAYEGVQETASPATVPTSTVAAPPTTSAQAPASAPDATNELKTFLVKGKLAAFFPKLLEAGVESMLDLDLLLEDEELMVDLRMRPLHQRRLQRLYREWKGANED